MPIPNPLRARGRAAAIAVLVELLCAGVVARAEDAPEVRFRHGERLLQAGLFEEAVKEFQAAYDLDPQPAILMNIGLGLSKLGRLDEAESAYRRFLQIAPPDMVGARRLAERRIEALASRAAPASPRSPAHDGNEEEAPRILGPGSRGEPVSAPPPPEERPGPPVKARPRAASERPAASPLAPAPAPPRRKQARWPLVMVAALMLAGGVVALYAATRSTPATPGTDLGTYPVP